MFQDLKYSVRSLARTPFQTSALVLILALGIGLNSAMFSVVSAVLLRPLPYPEAERLVAVWESDNKQRGPSPSYPNFADLKAQSRRLESLAVYVLQPETAIRGQAAALRVSAAAVSRDFFKVLGVAPALGRAFSEQEGSPGAPPVAVLSHSMWASLFGGDDNVLGRTVFIEQYPAQIIGVMPAGFDFPERASIWVNYDYFGYGRQGRTAYNLSGAVGRIAPDATLQLAQLELDDIAARMAAQYSDQLEEGFGLLAVPLHRQLVGDRDRTLYLLLAAVLLVLLVACGNIANILLTRSMARAKEMAIRRTLGAGRSRLIGQLLSESLMIGLAGAAAGLLACAWSMELLNRLVPEGYLHSGAASVDWRVVLFALALGVLSAVAFGTLPILRAGRASLSDRLRGDSTSGLTSRNRRTGRWFAIGQYAMSLTAVLTAGLIVKSLLQLSHVDPGFSTGGIVTAEISLPSAPSSGYADTASVMSFYDRLMEKARGLAGVRMASLDLAPPLSASLKFNSDAVFEGVDGVSISPDFRVVGPRYFETISTPLLRGRDFREGDNLETDNVAVINLALARRVYGSENPLGRRLAVPGQPYVSRDASRRWMTVVGVAADVRSRHLSLQPRPAVYVPYQQHPVRARYMDLVVSTEGSPQRLVAPVRSLLQEMDPQLVPGRIQSMDDWIRLSLAQPRFQAGLLGGFGAVALALAIIGVFGVMSYSVAQRRREIAVRMAVGARRSDILRLLGKEALIIVVAGQLLGAAAGWGSSSLLQGLLFQVEPTDPSVFLACSLLAALTVMAACLVPARRAGRLDPVHVLRAG